MKYRKVVWKFFICFFFITRINQISFMYSWLKEIVLLIYRYIFRSPLLEDSSNFNPQFVDKFCPSMDEYMDHLHRRKSTVCNF